MIVPNEEPRASLAVSPDRHERGSGDQAQTDACEPILNAYSRQGGVLSGEEVSLLMRRHCAQPVSQLARWIVGSDIVFFEQQGQTWIPLFQFNLDDMSIRPAVSALLAELAPLMDSDELAAWFVGANDWLAGASPLEAIEADFPAVLEAARADCFVVGG